MLISLPGMNVEIETEYSTKNKCHSYVQNTFQGYRCFKNYDMQGREQGQVMFTLFHIKFMLHNSQEVPSTTFNLYLRILRNMAMVIMLVGKVFSCLAPQIPVCHL